MYARLVGKQCTAQRRIPVITISLLTPFRGKTMKSVLRQSASPALARHGALLSVCTLGLLGAAAAPAETLQQRLDATKAQLTQLQNFAAKLSASQKIRLSSSAQHLLFAAENIDQITAPLTRNPAALNAPLQGLPFSPERHCLVARYRTRAPI